MEMGEAEQARDAHFDFFIRFVEMAGEKLGTAEALEWVRRLDAEHDNIRAAIEWGAENHLAAALKIVPELIRFWVRRGHEEEGRRIIGALVERAEKMAVPPGEAGAEWQTLIGHAWNSSAMLAYSQGDNDRGIDLARRAVDLARTAGDQRLLAEALTFLGASTLFLGRFDEALPILEQALEAARASGIRALGGMPTTMVGQVMAMKDPDSQTAHALMSEGATLMAESGDRWMSAMAQLGMAMSAKVRGDHGDARKRFSSMAPLFQDLGDRHRLNMIRSELAHIDRYEGQLDRAEAAYRETILQWKRLGHRAAVAHQLESFAFVAQAREDRFKAARLYGAAEALRERIGIAMTPIEQSEYDVEIARLKAGMEGEAFAEAWKDGRGMTLEQAVAFALEVKAKSAA
jgi:tetratricopeptide (TPR) repeat protein